MRTRVTCRTLVPARSGRIMKPKTVRLFVKPFCGWCAEAEDWLRRHGVGYETLNVTTNSAAREEMRALTGQTLAPSIDVDGHVLGDFDTDQLEEFLTRHGYDF